MSQVNANQELFLDILTKEEKEALLTKKMEEIRKKNEALRKRREVRIYMYMIVYTAFNQGYVFIVLVGSM